MKLIKINLNFNYPFLIYFIFQSAINPALLWSFRNMIDQCLHCFLFSSASPAVISFLALLLAFMISIVKELLFIVYHHHSSVFYSKVLLPLFMCEWDSLDILFFNFWCLSNQLKLFEVFLVIFLLHVNTQFLFLYIFLWVISIFLPSLQFFSFTFK